MLHKLQVLRAWWQALHRDRSRCFLWPDTPSAVDRGSLLLSPKPICNICSECNCLQDKTIARVPDELQLAVSHECNQ